MVNLKFNPNAGRQEIYDNRWKNYLKFLAQDQKHINIKKAKEYFNKRFQQDEQQEALDRQVLENDRRVDRLEKSEHTYNPKDGTWAPPKAKLKTTKTTTPTAEDTKSQPSRPKLRLTQKSQTPAKQSTPVSKKVGKEPKKEEKEQPTKPTVKKEVPAVKKEVPVVEEKKLVPETEKVSGPNKFILRPEAETTNLSFDHIFPWLTYKNAENSAKPSTTNLSTETADNITEEAPVDSSGRSWAVPFGEALVGSGTAAYTYKTIADRRRGFDRMGNYMNDKDAAINKTIPKTAEEKPAILNKAVDKVRGLMHREPKAAPVTREPYVQHINTPKVTRAQKVLHSVQKWGDEKAVNKGYSHTPAEVTSRRTGIALKNRPTPSTSAPAKVSTVNRVSNWFKGLKLPQLPVNIKRAINNASRSAGMFNIIGLLPSLFPSEAEENAAKNLYEKIEKYGIQYGTDPTYRNFVDSLENPVIAKQGIKLIKRK